MQGGCRHGSCFANCGEQWMKIVVRERHDDDADKDDGVGEGVSGSLRLFSGA